MGSLWSLSELPCAWTRSAPAGWTRQALEWASGLFLVKTTSARHDNLGTRFARLRTEPSIVAVCVRTVLGGLVGQQGTNQIFDHQVRFCVFGRDGAWPVGSRRSVVSEVVEDALCCSTLTPGRNRCHRAVLGGGVAFDLRTHVVEVYNTAPS